MQTQSRYKPPLRKCNQLLALGIERLGEVIPHLVRKTKHDAFSTILRFLAFQHMNALSKSRQTSQGNSLQASKRSPSPKITQYIFREEYEIDRKKAKNIQSSQNIVNL